MFDQSLPVTSAYGHMATHDVLTNVLMSATIVGVVYGYLSLQRARRLEVAAAQLNEQLTRAQLDTLRAQINPHFLFNSLNSVAVLARRGKVVEVEHMVTRLADLLAPLARVVARAARDASRGARGGATISRHRAGALRRSTRRRDQCRLSPCSTGWYRRFSCSRWWRTPLGTGLVDSRTPFATSAVSAAAHDGRLMITGAR